MQLTVVIWHHTHLKEHLVPVLQDGNFPGSYEILKELDATKTSYSLDIIQFGWKVKGIPSSAFAAESPALGLLDVLSSSCKAEGKACSSTACSCQMAASLAYILCS